MATKVHEGRFGAALEDDGAVVFCIGMRFNRLWRVDQWLPVLLAMPKMLAELARSGDLGLLGRPRTFWSGRIIMVHQVWSSFEQLDAYARSSDHAHLPAWRRFNRKVKDSGTVGIFHETYVVNRSNCEAVYANMVPFGLGAAVGLERAARRGQSARERLGQVHLGTDPVPVAPY